MGRGVGCGGGVEWCTVFSLILIHPNTEFVSAQYFENKLIELDQILHIE